MLLCFWIPVLFGHSEIDDMNDIGGFSTGTTDKEIVGFDISVNQVTVMNRLDSGQLQVSIKT
jgi:hypothetical protein